MRNKSLKFTVESALIAAVYTVLSIAFVIPVGGFQIRIAEALTVLPCFTPAAIPGLFVGCIVSNLITGALPADVIFGSLATLLGAVGTYLLRKCKWLAPLPPIAANTLILPFVIVYAYASPETIWYFILTVGAGEILSCGVLGTILTLILNKLHIKM